MTFLLLLPVLIYIYKKSCTVPIKNISFAISNTILILTSQNNASGSHNFQKAAIWLAESWLHFDLFACLTLLHMQVHAQTLYKL